MLPFRPGLGTGVQWTPGREQPYIAWRRFTIERFCFSSDEAYVALQEAFDLEARIDEALGLIIGEEAS